MLPGSSDEVREVLRLCRRKIMASLFYEASTRTDMSFQAAMLRMGGEVIASTALEDVVAGAAVDHHVDRAFEAAPG